MSRAFRIAAAGVVASLFVGSPAAAIGGGDPAAEGAYPFVAYVRVADTRACSGVLVGPEWVLTAASCVAEARPADTSVVVGRTDLGSQTGHARTAVTFIRHPQRNLALTRLDTPVDGSPVRIASSPPAVGEVLRIAGYGRTATEWVPDRLHTARFTVRGVAGTSIDVVGSDPATVATCLGDAGGPALREAGGRVELVGVNDTSWQNNCLDADAETRQGATETRVDDLADWIRTAPDSPAGVWALNETEGNVLADTNGMRPARPATMSGGPALGRPGRLIGSTAVDFDGVDDQAATGGPVVDTSRGFTVAAWARPATIGRWGTIVAADGARNSAFFLRRDNIGRWHFTLVASEGNPSDPVAVNGNTVNPPGVWAHVVGVYDAVAKQGRLYVNGALEGMFHMPAVFAASGPLVIGRHLWLGTPTPDPWQGGIAEVRIWDRAVPAQQIAGMAATRVGAWALDGNGTDQSGRGNDLAPVGPVTYQPGVAGPGAVFNGSNTALSRPGPVLRTDQSYTVMAWARLNSKAGFGTIIAQTGNRRSAFELQYEAYYDRYRLLLTGNDSDQPLWGWAIAGQPPTIGVWQHLAAVYDATKRQARIYVGGALAGTTSYPSAWHADGAFVVGRDQWLGVPATHFAGTVDDVRVYQGVLPDSEIVASSGYPHENTVQATTTPELITLTSGVRAWRLSGGTTFELGQFVQVGMSRLVMQPDGNFVLYDEMGRPRWASNTSGVGARAALRTDGNLVVLRSDGGIAWSTGTSGNPNLSLVTQDDGDLVLYAPDWRRVWATNTSHPRGGSESAGILRGVASNLCADMPSANNLVRTFIWDCHGGANQRFAWTAARQLQLPVPGGTRCLDALNWGQTDGTAVVTAHCHDGANQKWQLNGDGTITNALSGLCLDATGAAKASPLQLLTCHGKLNQKWTWH